jgi:hypothetical protein
MENKIVFSIFKIKYYFKNSILRITGANALPVIIIFLVRLECCLLKSAGDFNGR